MTGPEKPPQGGPPQGTTYQAGTRAADAVAQAGVVAEEISAVVSNIPQSAVGSLNKGRIVAVLTAVAGLCAALAPALANLDLDSTIGVIGGIGAIAAAANAWLRNWGAFERDVRDPTKYNSPPS